MGESWLRDETILFHTPPLRRDSCIEHGVRPTVGRLPWRRRHHASRSQHERRRQGEVEPGRKRDRSSRTRPANEAIDRRVAELVIDSDEVERDVVFGNVFGNVFDEHPMPIDDAWTSGYDRPISDDRCLHGSVAGVSCLIDSSMADDRALERSVADFSDSEITKMMQDRVVNDFIVKVMGDDKL